MGIGVSRLDPNDIRLAEGIIASAAYPLEVSHELRQDSVQVWMAVDSDPMGLLVFRVIEDEVHVTDLVTAPLHRRKGVARKLLDELVLRARTGGLSCIRLAVNEHNQPANQLYTSVGFSQVALVPDYYGPGASALMMELPLRRTGKP
jgi:ribosomal protein S18 acetylase RimI-like enzyme